MTQWQRLVDESLTGTGFVTMGAIFGHNASTWAFTPGLRLTIPESQKIMQAFSDITGARLGGLMVGGQKYTVIVEASDSVLKCMVRGYGAQNGFVANKTNQAVVLGVFNAPIQLSQAAKVVTDLADYLIDQGA